jgi:hypothetical protein
MKVIKNKKKASDKSQMTSLKGYVNATFSQLVEALGEPTFSTPSGDNKVQKEWVVEYKGNVFTVYDWKTYDEQFTLNELTTFNVGGHVAAFDFIESLECKLIQNKTINA